MIGWSVSFCNSYKAPNISRGLSGAPIILSLFFFFAIEMIQIRNLNEQRSNLRWRHHERASVSDAGVLHVNFPVAEI